MSAPAPELVDGHMRCENHSARAVDSPSPRSAIDLAHPKLGTPAGATSSAAAMVNPLAHTSSAAAEPSSFNGQSSDETHALPAVEGDSSAAATGHPRRQVYCAAAESSCPDGHRSTADRQLTNAARATSSESAITGSYTQSVHAGSDQAEDGSPTANVVPSPTGRAPLADPFLAFLADMREDLQLLRIANENRLRHLTRDVPDEDGVMRGLGMDERSPEVASVAAIVEAMRKQEHQADLNLKRQMRKHPLAPWLKQQRGVGVGTLPARLLAIIGDPYVNVVTGEVRTVSQLLSYCGHGDPNRKRRKGMSQADALAMGNPEAKKVLFLISTSILKAGGPWREVYDARKEATEGRVHADPCVRCGPSGKPAAEGSPWSNAHRHADALRITGKRLLAAIYDEAKRLHNEES